ncbi:MAG: hypothetical protein K0V04_23195 [Deltaproteobacteria bacterium]|nr:hypothetical protein [Deltaproteobacteria bacterium]
MAALLFEPELRVAVVVLTEICTLWDRSGRAFEAFRDPALARLAELHAALPSTDRIAMAKRKRAYNAAGQAHRAVRHWQETIALLEGIWESGVDLRRIVLVPGMERWVEIDNPYRVARVLVAEQNARVGIQPGDVVGVTQSSTSCVARWLHENARDAIERLRNTLAPSRAKGSGQRLREGLLAHIGRWPGRVLLVLMRRADENRQHNTTLDMFMRLAAAVEAYNRGKPREEQYLIVPLGNRAARSPSDESGVAIPEPRGCLAAPFNMYRLIEQLDRRALPARATRSLVAEFWRVVADLERFSVFGGRSGSLDIAAFMGVPHVFCFDRIQAARNFTVGEQGAWAADDGNIRLFLTWRLMTIGFLDDEHRLDPRGLGSFLARERRAPNELGALVLSDLGYATCFRALADPTDLAPVSNAGPIARRKRRWALLLYDFPGDFPSIEEFFGGGGGGHLGMAPRPYDLQQDATEPQDRNTCGVRAAWNAGAYQAGRVDALMRGFVYTDDAELPIDYPSDAVRRDLDERNGRAVGIVENMPDLARLVRLYRAGDLDAAQVRALSPIRQAVELCRFAQRQVAAATFVINTGACGAGSLSAARGGLHWIAVHVTRTMAGRLQFRYADSAGHGPGRYRALFDRLNDVLH